MNNTMTHYMELLASNQPWNLLIFMAIPVICAETLAISELIILFTRNFKGKVKLVSKITGIFIGIYFTTIFIYLFLNVVIPLTISGEWRGVVDVIAVGFYLLGVVPFGGIALLDLGVIGKNKTDIEKLKVHAVLVGVFLVVAHIAMILGMLNPDLFKYMSNMKM